MFVRPIPGVFEELLACEVGLVDTLFFQTLDNFSLGGNRCVVGTGHPAGIFALKACAAHKDILYCLVEHVPHVKNTGHVRRRNNYGKRFAAVRLAVKEFVVKPVLIPACFNVSRIVL